MLTSYVASSRSFPGLTEEIAFIIMSLVDLHVVQAVPDNKHLHSGAEVSICLFSNKEFHTNEVTNWFLD